MVWCLTIVCTCLHIPLGLTNSVCGRSKVNVIASYMMSSNNHITQTTYFCSFHSTPLYIIKIGFIILCSIKSNLKEFCPFPSCCVIIFHPIPVRSPLLVLQGDINRYITSLGQPCAYMVGEAKIKELRQRTVEALNDGFHLANFQDVVLWWLASLKVVEKCVRRSIGSATHTTA